MRLSMWMLADWLAGYEPVVQIVEGKRTLRNARLYSDDLKTSRSTVYLSQTQPGRVLCSNENDCLILRSDEVNEIFNAVLDAFDHYNECTTDAYDMIEAGCSLEEMLEFGGRLLGRSLIFSDATFYMRGLYDPEHRLAASAPDSAVSEKRILSADSLLDISRLPQIRMPGLPSYTVHPQGMLLPSVVTNLFTEGKHKGWLISIGAPGYAGKGELDLQDAFCEIFENWLKRCDSADERMERSGIFLELLEKGGDVPQADERLRMFGWHPGDPRMIYAFRPAASDHDLTYAMQRSLEFINDSAFLFRTNGQLMYIADLRVTPAESLEPNIRQALERFGCVAGKSPVFTDLSRLSEFCGAASVSARFAGDIPGAIRSFEDAELPYIAGLLHEHSPFDLRHPALGMLSAYDAAHEGQLSETLREFLRRGCGYVATAEALHIHRSTLLYRLERISDLTGIDLKDDRTRLHLQLSYLLDECDKGTVPLSHY